MHRECLKEAPHIKHGALCCCKLENPPNNSPQTCSSAKFPLFFTVSAYRDDVGFSNTYWSGNYPDLNFDVEVTFSTNCNNDCSTSTVGITELTTSKNLIQILDLMGRETTFKPNTALIYVYDDGSTEKVFTIE